MTFIIELCGPWQWRPGYFRSTVGGLPYRRVWWLFVAVTYYPADQYELNNGLRGSRWDLPTPPADG